jgi:glc operon protein GlcG
MRIHKGPEVSFLQGSKTMTQAHLFTVEPIRPLALAVILLIASSVSAQPSADQADGEKHLVTRNHVRLTLGGAERILAAAQEKAKQMNLKVNIAIVDDGGHLLAFARMDGARPASVYTALAKATASATMRTATGPIARGDAAPDVLLNLSLQHTAAAGGGKMTTLYGGVPVVVDEQIIGAVGCGGATGEQDAEIARAGISALIEALGQSGR